MCILKRIWKTFKRVYIPTFFKSTMVSKFYFLLILMYEECDTNFNFALIFETFTRTSNLIDISPFETLEDSFLFFFNFRRFLQTLYSYRKQIFSKYLLKEIFLLVNCL